MSQIGEDHLEHSIEDPVERGHRLADERKDLLAEIRKRPGFECFLFPKGIRELTPAASKGPIVTLTFSELDDMCFALVLLPNFSDGVVPLKLESFPPRKANRLYDQLKLLLRTHGLGRAGSSFDDSTETASRETFTSGSRHFIVDDSLEPEEALRSFIIECQNDNSNAVPARDGGPLPRRNVASQGFAAILTELWECVAKPILDALAITVSAITSIMNLLSLPELSETITREQASPVVVSDWYPFFLTVACCRTVHCRRTTRLQAIGFRCIVLYPNIVVPYRFNRSFTTSVHTAKVTCRC
jgi:hypothetical protein